MLAGGDVAGWRDGDRDEARFSDPFGVAVGADGTVYVADAGDSQSIRAISADGRVTTLARGQFNTPSGLAIDSGGALYVADTGNNAVRRVAPDGSVSTLAAGFNAPLGVAVDRTGRVIVADTYNDRIQAIAPDGTVTTLVDSELDTPAGVAVDRSGNIYVADTGSGLVRMIDAAGNLSTPAWLLSAGLDRPMGIAAAADGTLYITDDRGWIVEASPDGSTRTLAGSAPGFRDGEASEALFRNPAGIAVAAPGRLVVGDAGNAMVRTIAATSRGQFGPPAAPRRAPRFDPDRFGLQPLLWPVAPQDGPYEVAGTHGEARGDDGAGRFHAGIDVRVEEGTLVRAVRNGVVRSAVAADDFDSLNERMRIGEIGYVHIRAGRGPRDEVVDRDRFVPTFDESGTLARIRVKRGARFAAGDIIGTVNAFNHVHLNVGWPGEEHNPLRFRLTQFEDTIPPTIAAGGVRLYDESGQVLKHRVRGRIEVSGHVKVVVDAWDQADGNRPERRLGLYDAGYQVLNSDGSPAPGFDEVRHTLRFDRLSLQPGAARLVFAPGSGIPFYRGGRTRFLYSVTNTFRDGAAAEGFWDTTALLPGDYIVRIWAADIRGNAAIANRDVPVTVRIQ